MPADRDACDAHLSDMQVQLEAERASVEHWRRIARQRSAELTTLRRRPSVRALLGLERRLGPIAARLASSRRFLRSTAERFALSAGAVLRVGRRRSKRRRVSSRPLAPSPPDRRLAIVVVGPGEPRWCDEGLAPAAVIRVAEAASARAGLARGIEASAPDVVGVVHTASEPLDPGWLQRLAATIDGTVVASVPVLVHPVRRIRGATAHDGLVRAAGVGLRLDGNGAPQAVALSAGAAPRPESDIVDVDGGSGAVLLVDRAAYEAAGGLVPADDLNVATVELCARLRAGGGRVVLVPDVVVVDHRPIRARRDLRFIIDPTGRDWADAVGRSGAVLRRAADRRARAPLRLAVTVAAPSAKVAARWGDWHMAQALAASVRRVGHEVRVQTADQVDHLAGRSCDVHLVLRGLEPVRRTAGQRHVLWIISHPETIDDEELDTADQVLVASPLFAAHLRRRTTTPVEIMLQATDHRRFHPHPVDPVHRHEVTIVAKTRDVMRPVVSDALAVGLRPRIYGGGWRELVDPDLIVADHIDNELLPTVYSSAGVVLNDHWRTMRAWGFLSNRLFDVLACGTPVISDPVDGADEVFDGAVLEYHTPHGLSALVDEVLADRQAAHRRAERGRNMVVANHTFDHRARQLLDCIVEQR